MPMIFVRSFAVSLPVKVSPPPETTAVFVTLTGALLLTFTVRVIAGYVPSGASVSSLEQDREARLQFHPVPVIAVGVIPAGTWSVTVTLAVVGPPPPFPTV